MAMDDAANLVSELLNKLSELELKVQHHRQDMASEFQRHSRDLLQNVSIEISAEVEKAIKDSMQNYPALSPVLDQAHPITGDSPPYDNIRLNDSTSLPARRGKGSPPPLLPHTSGTPPDQGLRSPHEREREFQGLFTPSYLPLLDRHRENGNPSPSNLPTALPLPSTRSHSGELTITLAEADQTSLPAAQSNAPGSRPDPKRSFTEDTVSSSTSDESASKPHRRSALRRSSSSSTKTQSPRRVRFEVEGGEVLPTVSPPTSPPIVEHLPPSPLATYESAIGDDEEEDAGLLGTSPPMPKKITSTDRLKALARSSHEDTSKWTVVGDLQNLDEDEEALIMGSRKSNLNTHSKLPPIEITSPEAEQLAVPINGQPVVDVELDKVVDFDEEDEDLQEMPALSSFKGRKTFSPHDSPAGSPEAESKSSHTAVSPSKQPLETSTKPTPVNRRDSFDEEDMFDYEPDDDKAGENTGSSDKKTSQNARPSSKYIEEEPEAEEDAAATDSPHSTKITESSGTAITHLYSTSPAVPIKSPQSTAVASTPSRFASATVGSYKGRPFTISSVKDDELHERAAKMGDVFSFVGSVDGRSGVDESTSYRPGVVRFNGIPTSFSQRLMMEEFQEARKSSTQDSAN
ncbi:hypothetical protein BX600DRAFT_433548 [Xylariales sp. PMI_506]|nr:hypothetical protein BX600DRAFT_433548 [Xylariales sp. PMI_506]